jgi:hypothetical protein
MTSSNQWDPGSSGSTTYGQHTAPGDDDLEGATPVGPSGRGEDAGRAQRVAGAAKEEGAHVAETAKGEAQQVAGEAKEKAADILKEAKGQVDQQSRTQLQALASKLEQLSGEVDSMVQGSDTQGTATELARQLSARTHALSARLSEREPKDLLEDVRGFARQRPGAFLVGALATGIVAGRLTRGVKKAHDDDSSSSSSNTTPAPAEMPTTSSGPTAQTAGDFASTSAVGGMRGDPAFQGGRSTGGKL